MLAGLYHPCLCAVNAHEGEQRLFSILLQITVIMVTARVSATLFRKIRQPAVVGEIVAGLILGPSVLGKLESAQWIPLITPRLFDPSVGSIMEMLAQIGLIFLLFMIGLEFDFRHLRLRAASAAAISVVGVIAPFGLGILLGLLMLPYLGAEIPRLGFVLFLGTAMSITALPILGRMMMEMKVTHTRLAVITITAAAIDDATGWILLAAVSSLASAHFNLLNSVVMIAETLVFAVLMLFVVRPVVRRWIIPIVVPQSGELSLNGFATVLTVLFLCAMATNKIGIFAIFGAFMLGAVLSTEHAFRTHMQRLLGPLVTVFFLPIFFTYTGLRTDIGSINSPVMYLFATAIFAASVIGKLGGCAIAARVTGLSTRESFCVGIMMNTRALMALVVINVGLSAGIIPKSVFCMLVLMAVLTTIMTTPLLLAAMRNTELEKGLVASGFAKARESSEEVSAEHFVEEPLGK